MRLFFPPFLTRLTSACAETDFFEPQPKLPRPADAIILRNILHDWSDKYAKDILINLRQTAKADTKLMIVDAVVEHVCPTPVLTAGDVVPGYHPEVHPKPLLANLGPANVTAYNMDITVRRPHSVTLY